MKEFIISNIFGLFAGISNFFFFGSLFYLWGLKDPDGFGGVIGILFTTPFLMGMVVFRIFSKCRKWLHFDIALWTFYAILILKDGNALHIAVFQVVFIIIPLIFIVLAITNRKTLFKANVDRIDTEQ